MRNSIDRLYEIPLLNLQLVLTIVQQAVINRVLDTTW
jgi:hypothetical protein